ncbi:hydantoinase B/oxoprolinase family protein [Allorhodopirellula solitaria]|uniref:Acetophenone carboxylase gamma subunit n=1 Tax=Allorhodopirellula solitaria TaxID=2527987 RepID=A0A5C5WY98_9BACT|nr:hydantoinase B/oxoprolinase family protein [Allorhodopirellula solitaria]TWT55657.1 Acetophenone carboxylase gamma subunit [Allorhodopirellula solitaria]
MIEVWADIGGTFTDCLVTRAVDGASDQSSLKVLSSGLVTVDIASLTGSRELLVRMPSPLALDGFWVGAHLIAADGRQLGGVMECRRSAPPAGPSDQVAGDDLVDVALRLNREHRLTAVDVGAARLTLDAEMEAPVLATRLLLNLPLIEPLPSLQVRLGTTRGTNAILTRSGADVALLITEGFGDLLAIGTQDRPELFELDIVKPTPLPRQVIEVTGRLSAGGQELTPLDEDRLREQLQSIYDSADRPEVLAICLMHSYVNDVHERIAERIARETGFRRVVRSTRVAALPRIVPRAETTTLDAYLQPVLEDYVRRVEQQFGGRERCYLRWMTSGGNLVASDGFHGRESVLSGPAGGVVALAEIAKKLDLPGAVGLDMGGTSTDVSRFDGEIGRRQESQIGGIRVLSPMMDIHTVAAGGGSICGCQDGRLFVGPDSAGANPGPACYGRGGPLTITDVNVVLGRLPVKRFPFPLDVAAAQQALQAVHRSLPESIATSPEELAEGFLRIAVTQMAEAVRSVTTAAGNDVRGMTLVGFGGAAGGHLCRIADSLGMSHIVDHPQSGILSAVGIGQAAIGRIVTAAQQGTVASGLTANEQAGDRDVSRSSSPLCQTDLRAAAATLRQECFAVLHAEESLANLTADDDQVNAKVWADLRYTGTQSTLELSIEPIETLADRMDAKHRSIFGYDRVNMPIEIVSLRCETTIQRPARPSSPEPPSASLEGSQTSGETQAVPTPIDKNGQWTVLDREQLRGGDSIAGPAIVASPHSILVIEAGWTATVDHEGVLEMHRSTVAPESTNADSEPRNDAVDMEIVSRRVQGIAEAMGEVIRRTSVSVNVKERRDYSCAVFLGDGSLVANAAHVPVHLGAMGHTVRSMIASFPEMQPGDCFLSNDPFAGGSHLPDVTVVTPVFCEAESRERPAGWPCDYFVASRCHHAEIGGMVPGSMAPAATNLAEEGVLIRNMALTRSGESHHASLRKLLQTAPYPSRNVDENMADIAAAEAAGREGARMMAMLSDSLPPGRLTKLLARLMSVAGEATARWIESLGDSPRSFADQLDDGTPVQVSLRASRSSDKQKAQSLTIDFTGTGPVHPHGFNATRSIVTAAVLYVLRCVTPNELPLCDGVLDRIELIIPPGLLDPPGDDDPRRCPAVVAGNVETSNRVVDVLLGALGVAAASQGTMNNLLLGDSTFGYYETIGGGAGATPHADGADAVHTHMTNTRITDPEVLESRLPLRLRQFGIRRGSGGAGQHRGGDGIVREIEFLRPLTLSLITSRRTTQPYGVGGGEPGTPGHQTLIRDGREAPLEGCVSMEVEPGERLRMETPGGGGYS